MAKSLDCRQEAFAKAEASCIIRASPVCSRLGRGDRIRSHPPGSAYSMSMADFDRSLPYSSQRYLSALTATRLATLLSIGTALVLEFVLAWYSYGYFRSGFVAPSVFQYVGCFVGFLLILGGPFLLLLAAARSLLNRSVSLRNHALMTAVTITLALAAAEAWIGAQDQMLLRSPPPEGQWQERWFPFGFRSIVYDPAYGWHVSC